jgi:hypothetical protein
MLTNLRLADLRLTTAQQRSTGQNLASDLYHQNLSPETYKSPCYGEEKISSVENFQRA